jgi:acyl transferase domain-containing protein/acyl carrier protein
MSGALLKQSLAAIETLQARLAAAERARHAPIAIIGAGCRFPGGADDPESLWRLVRDGVDAVGPAPADRWETPPAGLRGGFLRDLDQFDPRCFGISPREADSIDPQHRLLLETAYEALERAGLAADRLAGSATGVFVGITTTEYAQLLTAPEADPANPYMANGGALSAAAGRLSFVFGFEGPSIAIDTACSSSLVAVHLAVQSLRAGESDLALAGGVNTILNPGMTAMLAGLGLMAADQRCKPFAATADGFVRSEGCGMVVLRRLSDALAAGDPILAVIRGSAVNSDGRSSGLTVPRGPAQEAMLRTALANAGLQADDIDYVEAHGTGTALGDPIEMEALAGVLARDRPPARPLLVGALKSNIGHAESAAGIGGLIKTVMALRHEHIPPTLHFHAPSPKIPWADMAVRVATGLTPWPRGARPRRAGVSGFGFSGTNAHIILEEAPAPAPLPPPEHGPLLVPFSARDAQALRALATRHADFIATAPAVTLADYAVTMGQGRSTLPQRLGVIAATLPGIGETLRRFAAGTADAAAATAEVRPGQRPKLAFLFTGQGAQYPGMGAGLYRSEPVFRDAIDRCAALLAGRLGRTLTDLMFSPDERALGDTANTQPALFALEYALAELWRSRGVVPGVVVGHSLGEYVAACIAGVFSLEDALDLVAERGRLMQALPPGGAMAALFAPEAAVAPRLAAGVAIAAVNGPEEVVISGAAAGVIETLDRLAALGVQGHRLDVSHAFHSALLDPMLDALEARCAHVATAAPRLTLISNLTGAAFPPGAAPDASYWRRHARAPVRFADCVQALRAAGVTALLEIGPHPTLLGLAARAAPDAGWTRAASLRRGRDDQQEITSALRALYLAGINPAWNAAGGRRTELPTTPFQRTRHWVKPPQKAPVRPPAGPSFAAVVPEPAQPIPVRTLAMRWHPAPETPAAPRPAYLLLGDPSGFARALRPVLRNAGSACAILDSRALPDFDPAALADALTAQPDPALMVVDCRALDGQGAAPAKETDPASSVRTAYRRALALIQATAGAGSCIGLCLLTQGAVAALPGAAIALATAPLPALVRAAAAEDPDRPILLGDLDPDHPPDPAAAARLLEALSASRPEAALRGGRILSPALVPLAPAAPPAHGLPARPDGTTLITGGLGAAGLELAARLVARGAGAILLLSRRPPDERQRAALASLTASGGRIITAQCDIADPEALQQLRTQVLSTLPPLRGVLHAAGVLADAPLAGQDADHFDAVARAKVQGAWQLHRFTLADPVESFVLFSSSSSLLGAIGQANYAAANGFLNGLAVWRRSRGLPGLAVAWGPWATDGMAASLPPATIARWQRMGLGLMPPGDALDALDAVPQGEALVAIGALDPHVLQARARPGLAGLLADIAGPPPADAGPSPAGMGGRGPGDALLDEIARVLGFERAALDLDTPLPDLGFDSMMAIQARNAMASRFGLDVPLRDLLLGRTLAELADLVAQAGPVPPAAPPPADAPPAEETVWEEGFL